MTPSGANRHAVENMLITPGKLFTITYGAVQPARALIVNLRLVKLG
jgi:hypothetical protein